jgi:hypothetical protein
VIIFGGDEDRRFGKMFLDLVFSKLPHQKSELARSSSPKNNHSPRYIQKLMLGSSKQTELCQQFLGGWRRRGGVLPCN